MAFVKTPEEMGRLTTEREHPEFYGAEMLFVFWETKPDIVARLLPPPLEPTPFPLASALVAYYPRTSGARRRSRIRRRCHSVRGHRRGS